MRSPPCCTSTTRARPGEWLPNRYGGRENLEAIAFLRELNVMVHEEFPGALTLAEESTAWPMVSRPTYLGGLGFSMKWNMGWMNDTLSYMRLDPIHRRYHHNQLTFGQLYAYTENFLLPLSHDEVVHGKGSLLDKMPGDTWQEFANLRLMLAYQFVSPGKKLNFMGNELAQGREWRASWELDWGLLAVRLAYGCAAAGARPQPPAPRSCPRCTSRTSRPRASAGSTATTPITPPSASCAAPATALSSSWCSTSHRCRA